MKINYFNTKNRLRVLLSTFSLLLCAFSIKAQILVGPAMTGTPDPGEYYNYSSITLGPATPGFHFKASPGNSFHIYTLPPDCQLLNNAFSTNQNYITTSVPRMPMQTFTTVGKGTCDLMQVVQYFDGLGRPLQTVQVKGSPLGNDIVQPVAYDQFGREAIKYLPYALTNGTSDGSYKEDALTAGTGQAKFYNPTGSSTLTQQANGVVNTSYPSAITIFEPSPLDRVVEQGAPGASWQPGTGHTAKIIYGTNGGTDVILWAVNSANNGLTGGGSNYSANTLYATTTINENGFSSIEYKDKDGHVVCKKTQSTPTAGSYIATCYVYDDFGNLRYVIPPNPLGAAYAATILETDPTFLNYIYGYHYDNRNRLVEKKIPGKGWEYMVYDKLDQVVATQDAVQRGKATQEWSFTKYDVQGRVIYAGIYQYPSSTPNTSYRAALQSSVDGQTIFREARVATGSGYDNLAWPQANIFRIFTLNYYDDYSYPNNPYVSTISGTLTNPTGLLTATKTEILLPDGTLGFMQWQVNFYDALGRLVQTDKQHYKGGAGSHNNNNYDEIDNSYNFNNQVTQTVLHHYVAGAQALATATNYSYDHEGRKTQTSEAIATGTAALPAPVIISKIDYNEIGQLKTKHLHSDNGGTSFLQDVPYRYNERGWLSTAGTAGNLFSFSLKYDAPDAGITPKFNGNITEMQYTAPYSGSKTFSYTYDPLNRLVTAASTGNLLNETLTYDNLGNIKALTRTGSRAAVLGYNYTNGNQLQTVTNSSSAFRSYAYDANGNATSDGGGKGISYNMLNLPGTITSGATTLAIYTYDAGGSKLANTGSDGSWEYIDGIVYNNNAIQFIQTDEGRAIPNGTSYHYEYNLTDHLGNVRVSFDKNPTGGAAREIQEDEYYSFGLRNTGGYNFSNNNRYLYNGKEIQTDLTDQYDYGARFYDPVIGRWNTVDPVSELMRRNSPYGYSFNNPVRFTDPDGMVPGDFLDAKGNKIGNDGIPDGKVYVVKTSETTFDSGQPSAGITKDQRNATVNFIKKHSGNTVAFVLDNVSTGKIDLTGGNNAYSNSVEIEGSESTRQAMVNIVDQDNGKGGTSDANNREYGGAVKSNGSGLAEEMNCGPVADPIKDPNAHIDLPAFTTRSKFHSHPSGNKYESSTSDSNSVGSSSTIGGTVTTGQFGNAPSGEDVNNSGSKVNYVFSRRNGTVYIYNNTGIIATLPQSNFATTPTKSK